MVAEEKSKTKVTSYDIVLANFLWKNAKESL